MISSTEYKWRQNCQQPFLLVKNNSLLSISFQVQIKIKIVFSKLKLLKNKLVSIKKKYLINIKV